VPSDTSNWLIEGSNVRIFSYIFELSSVNQPIAILGIGFALKMDDSTN